MTNFISHQFLFAFNNYDTEVNCSDTFSDNAWIETRFLLNDEFIRFGRVKSEGWTGCMWHSFNPKFINLIHFVLMNFNFFLHQTCFLSKLNYSRHKQFWLFFGLSLIMINLWSVHSNKPAQKLSWVCLKICLLSRSQLGQDGSVFNLSKISAIFVNFSRIIHKGFVDFSSKL